MGLFLAWWMYADDTTNVLGYIHIIYSLQTQGVAGAEGTGVGIGL